MTNSEEKRLLLVVDDAPANIQVVNSILKDDYRIRIATSGAKALDLANSSPAPDLILLDIMMPEIDGYEVCARLKASPRTRDIPVIFLTGKIEAEDETRGFRVGAVDYIHKPFSPPVVKARVETHLMLRDAREQLARQLSVLNSELEMAREIQLSILPREAPKVDGLEIYARYVPMRSVAGDFYDFIVVDPQHIGILVADVSGHGLPAALIASMLQVALTAQHDHASQPGKVLSGLNRALCGKFQTNFVTAAYMFVDLRKRMLLYAGAGHPPMLMWSRSSAAVQEVCENGLVLGQFPQATYDSIEVQAGAGDRCLLYTDGIVEAQSPSSEEFGIDRLKEFLKSNSSLAGGPFAEKLLERLARWCAHDNGESHSDDITLLTVSF